MRIIGGEHRSRRFAVPSQIKARPTTDFARENLFNVLNAWLDYDSIKALDLFAGTGAISFELISRGCPQVVAVERYPLHVRFIADVATKLHEENKLRIIRGDVFSFVSDCHETFDFIFADPPYDLPELPDIPALILQSKLLNEGGLFVMEHSVRNDFSSLPGFAERRSYGSVNFSFFEFNSQHR